VNGREFKDKTKNIALRVIRLTESLPNNITANVVGKQFLVPQLQSARIIEPLVGRNLPPI